MLCLVVCIEEVASVGKVVGPHMLVCMHVCAARVQALHHNVSARHALPHDLEQLLEPAPRPSSGLVQ